LRYVIVYTLFLLLLLTGSTCLAGTPNLPISDTQTVVQVAAVTAAKNITNPAATPTVEKITQIRATVQTNADINDSCLRFVLDITGPVQADGAIVHTPAPYLVVNIKGAIPGGIDSSVNLDGQIANSVSISTDGQNTKIMIELSINTDISSCRIFSLPGDVSTNKPFRVIMDISKPAPPPGFSFTPSLKDKVIIIDPGHGGSDAGAIGPGKTMEKTITQAVALKLKVLLEKAGAKVFLTRQEDCDVFGPDASAREELNARAVFADKHKADIFLSIHANASPNPSSNGTSTYYFRKTSYDALLAQNIQSGMVQAGGLRDRCFFPANFYVVKHAAVPAALIELAFLSNPDEEKLLNDPEFQQKMAQGIVKGVDNFFTQVSKK
jgi:N-acetylmuramoyl-L-alanine amidase